MIRHIFCLRSVKRLALMAIIFASSLMAALHHPASVEAGSYWHRTQTVCYSGSRIWSNAELYWTGFNPWDIGQVQNTFYKYSNYSNQYEQVGGSGWLQHDGGSYDLYGRLNYPWSSPSTWYVTKGDYAGSFLSSVTEWSSAVWC